MRLRKLSSTLGLCAALGGIFGSAPAIGATIIASDNFNSYPTGSLTGDNGGTGWASAWTGSANANVVATAAEDSPMTGNAVLFSGVNNNNAATRTLATSQSGNIIVDFLLQFNNGVINNNDFLALWFGSSAGPNIGLKANCGSGACTADIFARTDGTGGAFTYNLAVGETVRVFGYLQKTGTSSVYNTFDLWVNPSDAEIASLTGFDARFNTNPSSVSSFTQIGFRTDGLETPGDGILIDNLTISKVPEPGTLALFGIALLGAVGARRRRA